MIRCSQNKPVNNIKSLTYPNDCPLFSEAFLARVGFDFFFLGFTWLILLDHAAAFPILASIDDGDDITKPRAFRREATASVLFCFCFRVHLRHDLGEFGNTRKNVLTASLPRCGERDSQKKYYHDLILQFVVSFCLEMCTQFYFDR